MTVWIITFGIMGLFFVFMSVGLLMGGKPIKGSCGGLANVDGLETCELCGGSPQKCEELSLDSADQRPRPVNAMERGTLERGKEAS